MNEQQMRTSRDHWNQIDASRTIEHGTHGTVGLNPNLSQPRKLQNLRKTRYGGKETAGQKSYRGPVKNNVGIMGSINSTKFKYGTGRDVSPANGGINASGISG